MRSLLFVPGDDARKLAKGFASEADAVIIDLEDSVAPARKADARATAREAIVEARRSGAKAKVFVRVNALDTGLTIADLDGVMAAAPDGIVLPKSQSGEDVTLLGARLAVREAENGLEDGGTRILAIATETARALFHLGSYAGSSRRLMGLAWGGEDLSADIGAETNRLPDGRYAGPYVIARDLTLLAAAGAGVAAIDSVFTNFRDLDGLKAEAEAARRDGFSGKMAIHPAQAPVINAVFTPSPEAIARARAITAAFAAYPEAGVLALDGEMLDRPHLRRAERVLAAARAAGVSV
jgi:citrate lyase subunit beta/citryl-CoA lyase